VSSDLAARLLAIGDAADLEAMALPIEPTEAQAAAIRRAVVVFALWVARRALADNPGKRDPGVSGVEQALCVEPDERDQLLLYDKASGRFSFFDRGAANWLFGQVVASVVGRQGDFAIVAPAAAWAIHAIRAADEAVAVR
jgi:hypothetical protein